MAKSKPVPTSIDATLSLLSAGHYVGDRSLATVLFLALRMGRPLFLEGEAGVGKTEIAKVLAETLGRRLIRLQCYEGLDVSAAVYEWNYAAQMIAIRLGEAEGNTDRERLEHDVFSERFLIKRPLLQALEPDPAGAPVLLIDELDRTDEAFEAFLLEVLADYQVTIPEMGTVKAAHPPIVIITSNRTREIHDALKRRCLYHWVGYPDAERELVDRAHQGAGHCRKTVGGDRSFRAGAAQAGIVQGAGRRRNARLGDGAFGARCGCARSGDGVGHARRAAQVSGRYRAARWHQGEGASGRRVARSFARGGDRRHRPTQDAEAGRLAENIVYFARALRAAGIPVGPGSVMDALEALRVAGVGIARRFLLDAAFGVREAARAYDPVRSGVPASSFASAPISTS